MRNLIDTQTLEDLITAFAYRQTMERNFYWKRETGRVVEVSILDYALVSDCKVDYNSGLDLAEEREVKEAIIASEKKRNSHVLIPRLTIEQRIGLMNKFISTQTDTAIRDTLQNTLTYLTEANKKKILIDLVKNGFSPGFELDDLTMNSQDLAQTWRQFYRTEIKKDIYKWLTETNNSDKKAWWKFW